GVQTCALPISITHWEFDVICVVGIGIVCGILLVSKIIQFFLMNYRTGTFALILGLVTGSLVVVFPGFPVDTLPILVSVVTFALGLLLAYILGKVEYKA